MVQKDQIQQVLSHYTQQSITPYLIRVWEETPFLLSVSRPHSSSFGYYKYYTNHEAIIRLNYDLSPSHFILTYLHEVAHHRVKLRSLKEKKRFAPHGIEWKREFQSLMTPVLQLGVFPSAIQAALARHMQNPPASSARDITLTNLFRLEKGETAHSLFDLPEGNVFTFRGREFKLIAHRRTRALCEETSTQQKYLISRSVAI